MAKHTKSKKGRDLRPEEWLEGADAFSADWVPRWSNVSLYSELDRYWAKSVAKAVQAYEANPLDFYAAYYFLFYHPANTRRIPVGEIADGNPDSWFTENLHVMVTKVDPVTKRIEDGPKKGKNGKGKKSRKHARKAATKRNTRTQVWLEWGPYLEVADLLVDGVPREHIGEGSHSHDHRVDTGGDTFEKAIVNLAHNVYVLYGFRRSIGVAETLQGADRW